MSFKIKDLMITVLPAGSMLGNIGTIGPCEPCTKHCTECSICTCTQCTQNCTHSAKDFNDLVYPPDLALLKERLKIALAEVEARERVVEESLRPKTLADVELLEQKLTAALEELRATKERLTREASEGQGHATQSPGTG